ncbi:hypothetical protein [Cohnella lupini]|uniref:Uncharacterized protein n=1 Tax=Cohnella lupini TaxID=1294267 RepID=A0A3D9I8H6_9BACL|nr:hypothetical protein [Cohnella lupini]RED58094.1 hypothetical protein DFP95_109131 [Cohnella lupini]
MNDFSSTENGLQATLQSDDNKRISHYESIRQDIREEIKLRIRQRDKFAAQMVALLTLIFAFSFTERSGALALAVAPFPSVFYTWMILHSYRKQDWLNRYMREVVEPELTRLCRLDPAREWETYHHAARGRSGTRRSFFLWAMWVVNAGSMTYLWFQAETGFRPVFYAIAGVYLTATICATAIFAFDTPGRRHSRHKGTNAAYASATGAYLS